MSTKHRKRHATRQVSNRRRRRARVSSPEDREGTGFAPYGPLDLAPADIASLSNARLVQLCHALCRAEASLVGIASKDVLFGAQESAADEGCDGWTPRHDGGSQWIPKGETCWQVKAGTAGQPANKSGGEKEALTGGPHGRVHVRSVARLASIPPRSCCWLSRPPHVPAHRPMARPGSWLAVATSNRAPFAY